MFKGEAKGNFYFPEFQLTKTMVMVALILTAPGAMTSPVEPM
jgi:hypothetical protein